MKSARQTAFEILLKIQKDGAYSNLAVDSMLSENTELDSRDSAFVSALVYGTTERRISVDYNLSLYHTTNKKTQAGASHNSAYGRLSDSFYG